MAPIVSRPLLPLAPHLKQAVASYQRQEPLGFGQVMAPVMVRADYSNGEWSMPELVPYQGLTLDPACKSLHYGQQVFEGMKAFALETGEGALFRPQMNLARLNDSAARMAMPAVPSELFMQSLESLVWHLQPMIPRGPNESLYLRPLMLATDVGLSLKPSTSYVFLVIASPSGGYFAAGKVTALIERRDCRAAPGGTGAYKVAGNYGAGIRADIKATQRGCQQTLWLDAVHKSYIEEFSGMNFFAVVDGELCTPSVSDSVLRGVTRDSVIQLARGRNIPVAEKPLHIDELLAAIKRGLCAEMFACGTAAVITPVDALAEIDGTTYEVPPSTPSSLSLILRDQLMAMQTGRQVAPDGWLHRVGHT